MPETKTQRSTDKRSTAAKAAMTQGRRPVESRTKIALDRTTELSKEVAQSVEDGQRAAIDAVQKFVDAVDHALPALPHGEGPSRRQEIVDSGLQMADRLVHAQYDFIRKVVDSTGRALSKPGDAQ